MAYMRRPSLIVVAVCLFIGLAVRLVAGSAVSPQTYADINDLGLGTFRTVVITFGSDCDACNRSLPFYKRLLAADGIDHKERRLIVLSLGGAVPVRDIWVKAGLKPSRIVSYPTTSLLREISDQAPELIVLDGPGKRLGIWRGWLGASQEDEVMKLFL